MKRGASGLSGILAINKAAGMTSHDVVNKVRALTGEKRVGHAGTLDPAATGLLLVCVGPATRLVPYLTGHDKRYLARIVFGAATDTDDADGRIVTSYTGKEPGQGLEALVSADLQEIVAGLVGTHMQLPPAYSAIKKNGVTAYKAAREGKELELEPREVTIYDAKTIGSGFAEASLPYGNATFSDELPYWSVMLHVSKGTYIRSIARDLGQKLGCGAYLEGLRRVDVGNLNIGHALTLDQLEAVDFTNQKDIPWADPIQLLGFPVTELDEAQAQDVSCGRALEASGEDAVSAEEGALFALVNDGALAAVYEKEGGFLKPKTVIPGGVAGAGTFKAYWGDKLPASYKGRRSVVAIGVFDGLHLGHRDLLSKAAQDAAAADAPLTVLTFLRDPDELVKAPAGTRPPRFKLATNAERIHALAGSFAEECKVAYGVKDYNVITIPVTRESLAQSVEEFLDYFGSFFDVVSVHVGEGFRFGARALGTQDDLVRWCEEHGATAHIHPLFEFGGAPVSSTRIRGLISQGKVEEAADLRAGALHLVSGRVVEGRGEGTGMGFATANLDLRGINRGVILPAEGVYACWAALCDDVDDRRLVDMYPAAVNVGTAASFKEATSEIEAHLLGAEGDLYGKICRLFFVKFLRPQKKFDDVDELIATVKGDIAWVRENLTKPKIGWL